MFFYTRLFLKFIGIFLFTRQISAGSLWIQCLLSTFQICNNIAYCHCTTWNQGYKAKQYDDAIFPKDPVVPAQVRPPKDSFYYPGDDETQDGIKECSDYIDDLL